MALSEAIFRSVCSALVKSALLHGGKKLESWTTRKRMEAKLQEVTLSVFENIEPLFSAESIPDTKQDFVVQTCLDYINPLLKEPEEFYRASLSGEKLRQRLFTNGGFPKEIIEEHLQYPFQLVFPRIADLFCASLPLVAQLRDKEIKEILHRFDEVQKNLASISAQLAAGNESQSKGSEHQFHQIHKLIYSEIVGTLSLTGLHGVGDYEISLDDIFVLPDILPPANSQFTTITDKKTTLETICAPRALSIVEGQPGSGKTTWSGWLQRLILSENPRRLAVRLRFRDYANVELPSYYDLIRKSADPHLSAKLSNEQIDKWMEEGRVVIILDGFDEVAPGRRDSFRKWIIGLSANTFESAILVTSRPLSTEHLSSLSKEWRRWTIGPFNDRQIEDYIHRWYMRCPFVHDSKRDVDASKLAAQWSADRTLADLTGNPLMLSTLLAVHNRESQQLPRGRAKLYEKYIDGMLDLWEKRIDVQRDIELSYSVKRKLLQHIALWFLQNNVLTLGEEELNGRKSMHGLVREILPELKLNSPMSTERNLEKIVLAELRERTGMLEGPGTYSFVHKSVAEYLFAIAVHDGHLRSIDEENLDRHWLFHRRLDDRWLGVLYFWVGTTTVQNLKAFITDSGKDTNGFARLLELGLLHDQSDRLPRSFLIDELKRIVHSDPPSSGTTYQVTNIFGLPAMHSVEIRCRVWDLSALRHIGSTTPFLEFFSDKSDFPTDFAELHPIWQGHIFFLALFRITDSESLMWCASLARSATEGAGYSNYEGDFQRKGTNAIGIALMHGVIASCIRPGSSVPFTSLIEEITLMFPGVVDFLPLIALGFLSEGSIRPNRSTHLISRLQGVVNFIDQNLDYLRGISVPPELLSNTDHCACLSNEDYDLLKSCQSSVRNLRSEVVESIDGLSRVTAYVESLISIRK